MNDAILRIGIAGYGVVGKRRHKNIDLHPFLKVTSVCDRDESNFFDLAPKINKYQHYKEMLESEELDAIFVCMTNDIASEVTINALYSDLHVFCEKPPGRNVSEIENVIRVEKTKPELKLLYGFNHRHHESVIEAISLVKSKNLGKILSLRGVYGKAKLITFDQGDWRTKRDISGGGVLLDQGIHMVDLMRLFAGEFEEVHSFISNNFWKFDVEDNAYAIMKTSEGIVGMLHSSATQWKHQFSLDINLEKGSIKLQGILSGSKSYGNETLTVSFSNPGSDFGLPEETRTLYNKDPSWESEVNLFYNIITNSDKSFSGDSKDALETMKLVYKIYTADEEWSRLYNLS
jgi:predicted dehydrogenase